MESGSVIAEKLLPEKAAEPIDIMLSVSKMLERGQLLKAPLSIMVVELGMLTERRFSHPTKLDAPM